MRRWDRFLDSYLERYRARGLSPATVACTTARLEQWGRWLKQRRPRVRIEQIDAELITRYIASRSSFRAKVKSPFEFVASIRRAMNAPADTTPRSVQAAGRLGQPMWGQLTPNGWPDTADQWVNTGSLLNRINLATQVSNGGFPGITKPMAAGFDFSTPAFQRR